MLEMLPLLKKFFKVGTMYIKNTVNPEINQSQKKFFLYNQNSNFEIGGALFRALQ